jgi:ribose transport system substrate-binding protein
VNRLFLLASLSVALLLSQAGCNRHEESSSQGSSGKHGIAVIPKGSTHAFWKAVHAGADAAGKEFGYEIYWNAPELETDRERQIQIVEDFIVQKVDGLVLAPVDREAMVPSVEKLASVNIPCVIIDSAVATDKYLCFAATDNYKGGAMAARRMGKILDGKGKVVVIKYAPGSASTTERENGFTETLQKEFHGIEIVDSKYGMATVESALQASEDLLTRHPDLQGLFACNASTAVGAFRALQSQKRPEVKMVGFDAEAALLDGLRAGEIDSLIVQDPYKMGYEGVKAIAAHAKGQPVEKRIDTGVTVVTRESLEDPKIKELLRTQSQ